QVHRTRSLRRDHPLDLTTILKLHFPQIKSWSDGQTWVQYVCQQILALPIVHRTQIWSICHTCFSSYLMTDRTIRFKYFETAFYFSIQGQSFGVIFQRSRSNICRQNYTSSFPKLFVPVSIQLNCSIPPK